MADYRYKVEIELDEDKILREHKYDLESIYKTIVLWFTERNIDKFKKKGNELVFSTLREDDKACADTMLVILNLMEQKWYRPYVLKTYWYSTDEGEDYYENVIEELAKRGR